MANDITGNPWVLESTGTVWSGWVNPRAVRWDAGHASASGDQVILKDSSGRIVWSSTANGADFVDAQTLPAKTGWNGLVVDTIKVGKVYIEV
jgi:hypothetical protein